MHNTASKVSKYGVIFGPYFPAWIYGGFKISVFSPNTGKYGPGKTPCLHTFHVVRVTDFVGMRNYAAIIIIIVRYEFN